MRKNQEIKGKTEQKSIVEAMQRNNIYNKWSNNPKRFKVINKDPYLQFKK